MFSKDSFFKSSLFTSSRYLMSTSVLVAISDLLFLTKSRIVRMYAGFKENARFGALIELNGCSLSESSFCPFLHAARYIVSPSDSS